MSEFLFAPQNIAFAIALGLMLLIALFEGVGALLGAGLSNLIDGLIPDFDADLDLEVDDIGTPDAMSRLLGWLKVGKVPALMLIVVFLLSFGLLGYGIQYLAALALGGFLPGWAAFVLSAIGCLPITRIGAVALAAVLPSDESSAVSPTSFLGQVATITLGTARWDLPAEAKLTDPHGTTHYLLVMLEKDDPPLEQGARVLLVRQEGTRFVAIETPEFILND